MSRSCVVVGAGPGGADGRVSAGQRRAARHGAGGGQRHRRAHAHRARRRLHAQHRRRLRRQLLRCHARAAARAAPRNAGAQPAARRRRHALRQARARPQLTGRILRFPLISLSGKLRAAAMFARAALRRGVHIAKTARLARLDRGETVERWGLRTVGETAYHYLLRTGIEPFFYVGCEEISAAFGKALVRHALKWQLLVLPDGMGALCDALAQRIEVRTGCQASGVEVRDASRRRAPLGRHPRGRLRRRRRAGHGDRQARGRGRPPTTARRRQRALRAQHHALLRLRAPDHGAVSAGHACRAGPPSASRACARGRRWRRSMCPRARNCSPSTPPAGAAPSCSSATRRRSSRSCAPTPRRCSAASPIPTGSGSTRAPKAPSSRRRATTGAWRRSCAARASASSTPATGSPARPSKARCAPG